MLGRNPFSRSQVWAVGHRYREQPHYVATHDEMPGGIPCKGIDGRLDGDGRYHDEPFSDPLPRCVINEVCISQAAYFLNAGRELAFQPTLKGRVVGEQRPSEIIARFAGAEEVAARAQIDAQGGYTLTFPGGGLYEIHCGPICRSCFVASATCSHGFDFDLGREIGVAGQCPEVVRPGEPFQLQVNVRRLGSGTEDGRHRLSLRLHNLACQDPKATVNLTGSSSACVTFDLVPRRPAEPFLILVIPDGQLQKRAEWMGIVQDASR